MAVPRSNSAEQGEWRDPQPRQLVVETEITYTRTTETIRHFGHGVMGTIAAQPNTEQEPALGHQARADTLVSDFDFEVQLALLAADSGRRWAAHRAQRRNRR